MRRREFIALLVAVSWPFAARPQQSEQTRRIGVLMPYPADDPVAHERVMAFQEALHQLGWTEGRNVYIDSRWSGAEAESIRKEATELAALKPDVILVNGGVAVRPLQEATRTVPIVFVNVIDAVGGGFVASLAKPGGNATGFTTIEYGLSVKWLELLKQIAPNLARAAVLRNPASPGAGGQLGAIQSVAATLRVDRQLLDVRDEGEFERAIADFARAPDGGLLVTLTPLTLIHRRLIIALAAQHQLPAIYPQSVFVAEGGLIAYGADPVDPFRRAAGYVDRILKGEKPADLPVQAPTKYELAINLKTAKSLGLVVPPSLLAGADEVIE